MKRLLGIGLAVLLALSMAACTGADPHENASLGSPELADSIQDMMDKIGEGIAQTQQAMEGAIEQAREQAKNLIIQQE